MKLYMIRHGESEANRSVCHAGWAQISLTDKGFKDAEGIRGFLRGIKFDKIYSSDLLRAKQTAETAIPGCTYEESELIREIGVGSLSGKTVKFCEENYGQEYNDNRMARNFIPYGGESVKQLDERVKLFMDKVAESGYEVVAAFSHAGAIKAALDNIAGFTLPHFQIECTNCTVAVFEYKNGKWLFNAWIPPEEMHFDK